MKHLLFVVAGCAGSGAPLTAFPPAEPDPAIAGEVATLAPTARTKLEAELRDYGYQLTALVPTGSWEVAHHRVSGLVTERSMWALVAMRRGDECFLTEVPIYQPHGRDDWAPVEIGAIGIRCNADCAARFREVLPAGENPALEYFAPEKTIGRAVRMACDAERPDHDTDVVTR